jgi:hypothetical protein
MGDKNRKIGWPMDWLCWESDQQEMDAYCSALHFEWPKYRVQVGIDGGEH